jgi:hypothetical protein
MKSGTPVKNNRGLWQYTQVNNRVGGGKTMAEWQSENAQGGD